MNLAPLAAPESTYVVSGPLSIETITRSLLTLLPARHHSIARHKFSVLDTFDGRVQRAGAFLTRAGAEGAPLVTWQAARGCGSLVTRVNRPVSFAWDLPDSPLKRQVAAVIGPRRLLAQADTEERGSLLDLVDDYGKTVARLRIACGRARLAARGAWHEWPILVTLIGLRGYEKAYEQLARVVESRPGFERSAESPGTVILRHVGAPRHRDAAGRRRVVESTVRADAGAKRIHLSMLADLVASEPGLRGNLDTEFLHEFRVAVRRTRSLLGQIRGVFRPDLVQHFAAEFSWIGRLTGPPRDVDVLAIALRERDGEFGTDDMDALIAFVTQKQQQEYATLVEALDSDRYRSLLADWRAFLESPISSAPEAEHAGNSLGAVVSRRAWRLSRRIARRAKAVGDRTAAQELHQVRIDAKKLRYLVDATPDFYAPSDLDCIMTALKKMQRALGDFNDACVQQQLLLDSSNALRLSGGPIGARRTLGLLAERCDQRRGVLRTGAIEALSRFRARSVRRACRRAFKQAYAEERSR